MARLVDPRIARIAARRVAGHARPSVEASRGLQDRLARAVPRAEELVARASGIPAPPPVDWFIIDRLEWVEANLSSLPALMGPLGDKIERRLEAAPVAVRLAQRTVVSAEIGLLLGYVSRRVLGQYDLLVADAGRAPRRWRRRVRDGDGGALLYFVGPNIIETERRLRFEPDDFALWVTVHEMTHRFQFAGVPWLRERFLELVNTYMSTVDLDAKGLAARLGAAGRKLMTGSVPPEERNPVYLLATDDQRALLDDIQALMAVVEGHGNYVMDAVGSDVIPSFERMRRAFDRRRAQTNVIQRVIANVIGLEMKLRQYEMGQRFCETVAAREGNAGLARLWAGPDNLPTLAELKEPERWLKRVA